MADNKKVQEEDLKKLEDQAYFELCQIIAEAMQYQDVDLLDARIASWKNKYKKLLDRPSTNSKSDFKKRIEFLLNEYYSSVTQYILGKLKLHEKEKVENQSKALRELYTIIRDTNDYDLLKKKVDKWKEKYPVSGFLKMYQKRIELYTRDKNLRENAFKQEEAFNDLVNITKIHGTLDELKTELALWEEKYSINDKYNIDDFLKHQTEVKRYTSDEFLQSISREESKPDNVDKTEIDLVEEYNNNSFSNLSVQASAYATLLKISKSPNAVNEMFTWVYKNRDVKFNDKYKELILSATYLNYSPTYLNKLQKPKMDMSKNSLSFDEYTNINDIKKYAIISYFNLLLPPEEAIANDYFVKHIQTIYAKSEKSRVNDIEDETIPINSGIEISLKQSKNNDTINFVPEIENKSQEPLLDEYIELHQKEEALNSEVVIDLPDTFSIKTQDKKHIESDSAKEVVDGFSEIKNPEKDEIILDLSDTEFELDTDLKQPNEENVESNDTIKDVNVSFEKPEENLNDEVVDYATVVALSPLFFETINNYNTQAVVIEHIDSAVTEYVESKESKEISLSKPIKTLNNIDS